MEIPSPRARKRARIEIIPLIDIIFFLLATFVMVSLSMVKNRGIQVNLPGAETSVPQHATERVFLGVDDQGEIYWDKEPVTRSELAERLRRLHAETPDPSVFLAGDEQARLGVAVGVLDEIRKAGIGRVAIETKSGD
jgi:biopolymer transport protein ExbD